MAKSKSKSKKRDVPPDSVASANFDGAPSASYSSRISRLDSEAATSPSRPSVPAESPFASCQVAGGFFDVQVAVVDQSATKDASSSAQIWLSTAVMNSNAVAAGSLVAVALPAASCDFLSSGTEGLQVLPQVCQRRFHLDSPRLQSGQADLDWLGQSFVTCVAWPSPKLSRTGARLSWQLSDSLIRPAMATSIRVYPLVIHTSLPVQSIDSPQVSSISQSETPSRQGASRPPASPDSFTAPSTPKLTAKASVSANRSSDLSSDSTVVACIHNCKKLRLVWLPPGSSSEARPQALTDFATPPRPSSGPESGPTMGSPLQHNGLGKVAGSYSSSPHTPHTPQANHASPLPSRGRSPGQMQTRGAGKDTPPSSRPSPGGFEAGSTPSHKSKQPEISPKSLEAQRAAVKSLLEKGGEWQRGLVEQFVGRWLGGRLLLTGNIVMIPICGIDCAFQVAQADRNGSSVVRSGTESLSAIGSLDHPMPLHRVSPQTEISLELASSAHLELENSQSDQTGPLEAPDLTEGASSTAVEAAKLAADSGRMKFSALGGLAEQIAALRELVELPLRSPELFIRYGIKPPRGVLLYGPPGTGKTSLARAAASESGASMFVINGPEIVSEYFGESEQAIKAVFEAAQKAAPSVVFIDELDAIAPARGGDSEDLTQRMVAALLTILDGGGAGLDRVVVIAATNRVDSIDPALRRPGRFDRELEIGVPSPKGRHEILQALLRKMRHRLRPAEIQGLAAATHGFVGADLSALCSEAAMAALRRSLSSAADEALPPGTSLPSQPPGSISSDEGMRKTTNEPAGGRSGSDNASSESKTGGKGAGGAREQNGGHGGEDSVGSEEGDGREEGVAEARVGSDSGAPEHGTEKEAVSGQEVQGGAGLEEMGAANGKGRHPVSRSTAEGRSEGDEGSWHGGDVKAAGDEQAQAASGLAVEWRDFEVAKTKVRPSALREVAVEVPKVYWKDIGGNDDIKQRLQEAVEWPQKHAVAFERLGAQAPRGVLLYGPPGCSKTLMARAVATEAGLNFLAVKGPELFSKWVGQSEKAVRTLFARARTSAPSIVFFDEIDGLAAARGDGHGEGGTGVGDRVMSQLLTEMDGLGGLRGVVVMAATNRPDLIDAALLRPGRFDRLLYVGPPSEEARRQIYAIHLRRTPCGDDVDVAEIAAQSESYTGADIAAVCREAAMCALDEDIGARQVCLRHFQQALSVVPPSTSSHSPEFYASFQRGGQLPA